MNRILIVDDKEDNRYYLRTVLTGHGYTVEMAAHGAEALVKARKHPPELVISDLLMPVMDGYTLLRHWKADGRLKEIPFVVYTATYTEEEDEQLALSLGADAFVLKPAEPEDFLARIAEVRANAETVVPPPPKHPVGDETLLLKSYSETLIRKLEEKTLQLQEANRSLREDLAERRQIEEAMRASEASLEIAQARAHLGSWELDLATMKGTWSAEMFRLFRRDPALGSPSFSEFLELVHPDDRDALEQIHTAAGYAAEHPTLEYRTNPARSPERQFSATVHVTRDAEGRPVSVGGTTLDITDRKRAEAQLKLLETCVARFEDIVIITEAEPIGEPGPRIVFVNDAFTRRTGYTREEALGRSPRFLQGPKTSRAELDRIGAALRQWKPVRGEVINYTKSGEEFWLELDIVPVADARGWFTHWVAVERDTTERKRVEDTLQRLASIVECSDDSIIGMDLDGTITSWNRGAERVFGYSAEEIVGAFLRRIIPADRQGEEDFILQQIAEGKSVERLETVRQTKDGRLIHVAVTASPIRNAGGEIIGVSKVARDISDRKAAEQQLRINEQRYRTLVEATAAIVWDMPPSGEFEVEQPGWSAFTGQTFEELRGWGWLEAIHPDDRKETERVWQAAVASRSSYVLEQRVRAHDQKYRQMVVRAVPILAEDGSIRQWIGIHTDITERRQLEQQLLRSQRMESIGTLAGGIAHDLNNSLGPIVMSLELLKMRFRDAESQDLLAVIDSSAQRGSSMVRQVLSFARGVEGQRLVVQALHLIEDSAKIARETFPKNISIETEVPHNLWTLTGDPTQIHQVLMNLCVNARDAMPHGGRLSIGGENLVLDEHYAALNLEAKPGPYLVIYVEDSGTGMPPELIEKIFDPFFTTKEIGKGTGLGLSTSLAIVKAHGGFLRVYSEPGKGTKFNVYLPALLEGEEEIAAEPVAQLPRGDGELILVVDDEAPVRQITQRTLEAFGYRVLLANNGAEAIATYAQRAAEISAVVIDMMMPIMDGPSAIRVLRKMGPELTIIGTSGLSDSKHVSQASASGVKDFLPKPYTAETLLKTLRQALPQK